MKVATLKKKVAKGVKASNTQAICFYFLYFFPLKINKPINYRSPAFILADHFLFLSLKKSRYKNNTSP
jgi:hypothetical protein